MTRSVMIVSLLAATLAAPCGLVDLAIAADRDDDVEALQASLVKLRKALADERAARAADKAAVARAAAVMQGNFDSLKASLTQLAKNFESSLAMQKQLHQEKAALAQALKTANETARVLRKELDESLVQIRRIETRGKHYNLLLKDLRAETKKLQSELDKDAPPARATVRSQPVSGKITAVHGGVVSINIGRAKGVKEKMKLKIFRKGKFVAHVRIDLVESHSAAGVILDKKLPVLQGDTVATDLVSTDKKPTAKTAKTAKRKRIPRRLPVPTTAPKGAGTNP